MTTDIVKQRHAAYQTSEQIIFDYGSSKLFDQTFSARLQVTTAGLQIGHLAHYIRQGNEQEAAPIAAGLRESLRASDILRTED